jgi:molecular chaperone DnaK (HSP70)
MTDFLQVILGDAAPPRGKPLRVVGIDLGTTNSTIAEIVWHPERPAPEPVRCIPVAGGIGRARVLVPSMVGLHNGRTYVGEAVGRFRNRAAELGLDRNRDLFWECKNDIGLRRTYHRAPAGFRSAKEIGGKVLRHLIDAALAADPTPITRTVVTVPASFQLAQRADTLEAASLAGLPVAGGDLLDEPLAAFLDYAVTHGLDNWGKPGETKTLLVFDFGGGTCDVAVLRITLPAPRQPMRAAPLTVSRYHRLGGGDIDRAVLYECLLPQLAEQNRLGEFELTFEDKSKRVEPAMLGVAETLKLEICRKATEMMRAGRYDDSDTDEREAVTARAEGLHVCTLRDRQLTLVDPVISLARFERLLEPFLDEDLLAPEETEYRLTCSVFAPLRDALDRARLAPTDIGYCLLVGGSSLIPHVVRAVARYFPEAVVRAWNNAEAMQTAVARGAAHHALSLALHGRGPVQPVANDSVSIRTSSGPIELVPASAPLPFPGRAGGNGPDDGGDWAENLDLAVPRRTDGRPLTIELVNSRGATVFVHKPEFPPGARGDERLDLRFRLDENQVLDLKYRFAGSWIEHTIENPLVNVVNPQDTRQRIEDEEERLQSGQVPAAERADTVVRVANLYADLGQREKALYLMTQALAEKGGKDPHLLNQMGILCREIRDSERGEKFCRQAAKVSGLGMPLFNLSLIQEDQGKYREALASVEEAISRDREAPYLVQRAMLADQISDYAKREESLKEAFRLFGPPARLSAWELGWFAAAARLAGDDERLRLAREEQRRRGAAGPSKEIGALLPEYRPGRKR